MFGRIKLFFVDHPICTYVEKDGHLMTFGIYDRILYKLVHFLNDHQERRTEKMWARAWDEGRQARLARWDRAHVCSGPSKCGQPDCSVCGVRNIA